MHDHTTYLTSMNPYELRRESVSSCVSERCWLFVGPGTMMWPDRFLLIKKIVETWFLNVDVERTHNEAHVWSFEFMLFKIKLKKYQETVLLFFQRA